MYPNAVHIVKLTSGSAKDNKAAVAEIERKSGRLYIMIANAGKDLISTLFYPILVLIDKLKGISEYSSSIDTAPIAEFTSNFNVNTIGPVVLFQAVHSLLLKSPTVGAPQFNVISSIAGSIEIMLSTAAPA